MKRRLIYDEIFQAFVEDIPGIKASQTPVAPNPNDTIILGNGQHRGLTEAALQRAGFQIYQSYDEEATILRT